jgi:uncharacterized protein HemX
LNFATPTPYIFFGLTILADTFTYIFVTSIPIWGRYISWEFIMNRLNKNIFLPLIAVGLSISLAASLPAIAQNAGERISDRGDSISARGKDWKAGERNMRKGERLIRKSEERLSDGEKKLKRAREAVTEAERQIQDAQAGQISGLEMVQSGKAKMQTAEAEYSAIRNGPSALPPQ